MHLHTEVDAPLSRELGRRAAAMKEFAPGLESPSLVTDGAFRILVGSPTLADDLLGTSSPFAPAEVYDRIAKDLERSGYSVTRNPLVHRPTLGQALSLGELRALSREPDGAALVPAVVQLAKAGATDATISPASRPIGGRSTSGSRHPTEPAGRRRRRRPGGP